jgi:BirA family biotin operon repressor/biotin-[acetyl-CoA-carboxylase] ligase
MTDLPPPTAELRVPTRHVGRRVLYYEELPSTMSAAAALTADPANDGTAVLAGVQTAGRGQYGRTWLCPPGSGVLLGVLLFPPPPLRRPAVLTAWAAVAVAETVHRLIGHEATIKWPNDVLVLGKKVCGILIESAGAVGRPPSAVVGIGLNVNQTAEQFAAAGLPDAASLADCAGQLFEASAVAGQLLQQLDHEYTLLEQSELAALGARWARRIGLVGREVVAEATDGRHHRGRLRELTLDGLVLEQPGGAALCLAPEGVRHLTGT